MSRGKPLTTAQEPQGQQANGSSRTSKRGRRASRPTSPAPLPQAEPSSSDPLNDPPMLSGLLSRSKPSKIPIFVASLGNPKPYQTTLHSAGHIVLSFISDDQGYYEWRPFAGGQSADKNHIAFSYLKGYVPHAGDALPTLWRCGAMMNASGPAVKKAWLKWKQQNGLEDNAHARLVIVHDELERALGDVSVRTDPKASARGHNGIKSVMASLPNERFIRIGVGIGRPDSRDKGAVSNYVLRQPNDREASALELASRKVFQQIMEIEEGAVG